MNNENRKQILIYNVNWEFLVVFLLFAISLLVRFKIADFSKIVSIQPDEFRYYLLAKSFSLGLGMSINGFSTFYQKIFYSLCIAPSFWCENIFLTLTSIAFINSFLISLGIFPLYTLTKKILSNKIYIFLTLLIYIVFSDLSYSMTFMSEVVFLPLSLYFLLIFYNIISLDHNKKGKYFFLNLIAGILNYLLYLTKEISLVFILAYAGVIIFDLIKNKNFKSTKLLGFIIYLLSFILLFVLFKLTLFLGSGNSYNQQSFDILLKPGRFVFMIYSFFYFLGMTVLSLLFFPIILPILNFKKYDLKDKIFFLFLLNLLILSAGVVAYTISVREDFGNSSIRFHGRYITYLYLSFILYLFKCFELKFEKYKYNFISIISFLFLSFGFYFANIFNGINIDNSVCHILMFYLNKPNFNLFSFKVFLLLFLSFSFFLIYFKYNIFPYIFSLLFIVVNIYNNISFYNSYYNSSHLVENKIDDVLEISNFVSLNSDKKFIYLNFDLYYNREKIFYSYLKSSTVYYLQDYIFYNSKRKALEYDYKNTSFDYVISVNDSKALIPKDDFQEIILYNKLYRILKLKNRKLTGLVEDIKISILDLEKNKLVFRNSELRQNANVIIHHNGILYTPYMKLKKGKYEIEFILKNNNMAAELLIISGSNKNKIKKFIINKNVEKIFFVLSTDKEEDMEDVSFLIRNLKTQDLIVKDIILRRM